MPWLGKTNQPNRPSESIEAPPPKPTARPMGAAHQAWIRLNASVTTMAATPISTSLIVSHLLRVMLWFQVSRKVPFSSSREISGAPQKMPVIAGAARMARTLRKYRITYKLDPTGRNATPVPEDNCSRNEVASPEQEPPWQVVSPVLWYRSDMCDSVSTSTIANSATATAAAMAWARN